jgi:hypothetical protein
MTEPAYLNLLNRYKMKKVKYLFILLIGIAPCLFIFSCKSVLEPFDDAVQEASKLNTARDINAAIIGLYDIMQADSYYGGNYITISDVMGGNISLKSAHPDWQYFAMHQVPTNNTLVLNIWNNLYKGINSANYIIEAAANVKNANEFNSNAAIAEARCLRALFYFDLLRYFGGSPQGYNKPGGAGVPLWISPTKVLKDAAPKPRATEAEVYSQIISDLDFAMTNLPAFSVSGKVNNTTAIGIKARVQLYRGAWEDAESLATQATASAASLPMAGLSDTYANLWQQKNQKPESIWELQFSAEDPNTIVKFFYPTFWQGTYLGGMDLFNVSDNLKQAHEAGDIRMGVNAANSIPPVNAALPDGLTLKYTGIKGDDNVMLLRMAELYLIRAEARLRKASPDLNGAIADINLIRSRAKLPNTTASSVDDLATAIEKERRIELAFEGDIWFDLRRNNKLSTVGLTQPEKALLPIPQLEVENSGGIVKQNAGY